MCLHHFPKSLDGTAVDHLGLTYFPNIENAGWRIIAGGSGPNAGAPGLVRRVNTFMTKIVFRDDINLRFDIRCWRSLATALSQNYLTHCKSCHFFWQNNDASVRVMTLLAFERARINVDNQRSYVVV